MRFRPILLLPLFAFALAAPGFAQAPADPHALAGSTETSGPEAPELPLESSAPAPGSATTSAAQPSASADPAAPTVPAPPSAPAPISRGGLSSFGDDILVPAGQVVDEISSFGGDVVIEGRVLHDVSSFGGDVMVRGRVDGDVSSFGGDVEVPGSVRGDVESAGGDVVVTGDVRGEIGSFGGEISRGHGPRARVAHALPVATGFFATLGRFVSFAASRALSALFVFLLGLVLLGLAPARLGKLETVMVETPARVAAHGLVVSLLSALAMLVMVLSIVGIPAALLFAMLFPIACYVGLAATARVIGALLPTERLRGKPVLVLASGVVVLYGASLVPFVGSLALAVALVFGLGALSLTRFGTRLPEHPVERTPAGPFRTRPAEA